MRARCSGVGLATASPEAAAGAGPAEGADRLRDGGRVLLPGDAAGVARGGASGAGARRGEGQGQARRPAEGASSAMGAGGGANLSPEERAARRQRRQEAASGPAQ